VTSDRQFSAWLSPQRSPFDPYEALNGKNAGESRLRLSNTSTGTPCCRNENARRVPRETEFGSFFFFHMLLCSLTTYDDSSSFPLKKKEQANTKKTMKVLHLFSSAPLCVDDSVSSALSVDERDNKDIPFGSKKVTFDLSRNEFHNANTVLSSREECHDLWYNDSDYKHFKHQIASIAKAIQRVSSSARTPYSSYERVVEHTYELCCMPVSSGEQDEDKEECQDTNKPTKEDLCRLNHWAALATSRVGIVKWAVPTIGKKESMRRLDVVDMVLSIQEDTANVIQQFQEADKQEFIRKCCQHISRPSRLFSAVMAQAQATALLEEQSKEEFFS
jgi:hypothetical protein